MVNLIRVILAGALLVSVPVAVSAQQGTWKQAQTKEDTAQKNKADCEKKGKGPGECGGG